MPDLSPDVYTVVRAAASILPVVVFLLTLTLLDSYKLVRPRAIALALAVGVLTAFVSLIINRSLIPLLGWDIGRYSRYAAPVIEESAKAVYLIALIRTRRVGFVVDAAIMGFAIGAGFAIIENLYFMRACDLSASICVLRGFGTAIMHGGATAILGIAAQHLAEERWQRGVVGLAWGLAAAVVIHSLYNHFVAIPVPTIAGLVLLLPAVVYSAFQKSERDLRSWLGVGFDTDAEMLEMMEGGGLADSHVGVYLSSLKDRLQPEILADMLCMLRLRVELSVRAKGVLLMRDAGFEAPVDPEVSERFEELRYLERSIGRTGMLAMQPLLSWRHRDLWEMHMLNRRR